MQASGSSQCSRNSDITTTSYDPSRQGGDSPFPCHSRRYPFAFARGSKWAAKSIPSTVTPHRSRKSRSPIPPVLQPTSRTVAPSGIVVNRWRTRSNQGKDSDHCPSAWVSRLYHKCGLSPDPTVPPIFVTASSTTRQRGLLCGRRAWGLRSCRNSLRRPSVRLANKSNRLPRRSRRIPPEDTETPCNS